MGTSNETQLGARMLEHMRKLRLCNVDNKHDRGSYRMRFCAAALLALGTQVCPECCYLSGPALTLAAIFGVLTAGHGMSVLLRGMIQAGIHF